MGCAESKGTVAIPAVEKMKKGEVSKPGTNDPVNIEPVNDEKYENNKDKKDIVPPTVIADGSDIDEID